MAASLELPALHVEGDSDLHTIVHLLRRHGIVLDKDLGPVAIKNAKNDKGVLDAINTAVRASVNRAVGFVVDANGAVAARWQAVVDRLRGVDLVLPSTAPAEGFVGDSPKFKVRVGVWIMPDNATDAGNLEGLVHTLVPLQDALIGLAHTATDQARGLDARFPPQDHTKAVLHCWLAWQSEPGMPFGTALKAKFLRHDSETAIRFVGWFRTLFGIAPERPSAP